MTRNCRYIMMETAAIPSSPARESAARLKTMVVTAVAIWSTHSERPFAARRNVKESEKPER